MTEALKAAVASAAASAANDVVGAVVAVLRREQGVNLAGVIFYGSRLNRTAGPRSDWDFFVVVEDYRRAHAGRFHALLNRILPPSIYRREIPLADGTTARCKLSLLSRADLGRYTSADAPDSYVFGRLSKRVSLVHARDAAARAAIEDALSRSVAACAAWTLRDGVPRAPVEAFARAAVAFSYRCEERVEGPERARALFEADRSHFLAVYATALQAAEQAAAGGSAPDPAAVVRFVRRSRRRARLRWIKNIWTFEDWVDYMLAKIDRHQGLPLALSERERRHPLLTAVRHYLRLRRAGRLSRPGPV